MYLKIRDLMKAIFGILAKYINYYSVSLMVSIDMFRVKSN